MAKKKSKLLFTDNEWSEELILKTWKVIEDIAIKKYGLTFYPPQLTIVDADSMVINQSVTVGLPVTYSHWSHGKHYMQGQASYKAGMSGLAYELVINSNPSICYLMENNTMAIQALVLAHAAVGHSSFFKNNYLYKEGLPATYILPFMEYAKNYIEKCELRYGEGEVSEILDYAHSLIYNSMIYHKPTSIKKDMERRIKYNEYLEEHYNELYNNIETKLDVEDLSEEDDKILFNYPEDNLLYFIEKMSPVLDRWQREILRIVRIQSQYFYPQVQDKMINEGYATFWHYTLMHDLYEEGYISEGTMLEILDCHCGVCNQPQLSPTLSLNPYKLGSEIFFDIKRICLDPTEEDYKWFPDLAGSKDWVKAVEDAMKNYNDEGFVLQYLSPALVRKLKLLQMRSIDSKDINSSNFFFPDSYYDYFKVGNIHSEEDFKELRKHLSLSYNLTYRIPSIQVTAWDPDDKMLTLRYNNPYGHSYNLAEGMEVTSYIAQLMNCDVNILENDEENPEED